MHVNEKFTSILDKTTQGEALQRCVQAFMFSRLISLRNWGSKSRFKMSRESHARLVRLSLPSTMLQPQPLHFFKIRRWNYTRNTVNYFIIWDVKKTAHWAPKKQRFEEFVKDGPHTSHNPGTRIYYLNIPSTTTFRRHSTIKVHPSQKFKLFRTRIQSTYRGIFRSC